MTKKILEKVASIPPPGWRHRVDVGHGIITPGREDSTIDIKRLSLDDDLSSIKILDIGCSDGYFSFECESRGALLRSCGFKNIEETGRYSNRLYYCAEKQLG